MPNKLRIFVSHSSQDKVICGQLVKAIRDSGADVWYDEQNLGPGQLLEAIQREVQTRPAFIVLLSKAAFSSHWVLEETTWAYTLRNREPNRLILPVTVGPIEASDFNHSWLFLETFKRVEAPGYKSLPVAAMIAETLRLIALTPSEETPVEAPPPQVDNLAKLLAEGDALLAQEKFKRALPVFQQAVKKEPASSDAWLGLGHALRCLHRYDQAVIALERSIALDSSKPMPWISMGLAFSMLSRDEEAVAAFMHAYSLDPEQTLSLSFATIALMRLGRYDEVLEAYDKILGHYPASVDTLKDKSSLLRKMGRIDEAKETEKLAKALGG